MAKKPKGEVTVKEMVRDVQLMIVEKYEGRLLTWETAERALQLAIFEIKQAALFAPREKKK